jgi:hypothetical protein
MNATAAQKRHMSESERFYQVETFDTYNDSWTLVGEESENRFHSYEQARSAIRELRDCGSDFYSAQFRIVERV